MTRKIVQRHHDYKTKGDTEGCRTTSAYGKAAAGNHAATAKPDTHSQPFLKVVNGDGQ
jgi:hypothetical protein